ncbi:hypothetical protein [Candidatus Amarobacter glycogenicus]|uniref:hypothetical protein n=1 Tax=Candidatus Amarobacter glycogenicus TaxID=3140699 RepID=UPI002A0F7DE0|nr:hypothetical protein [Dehalococcoidia bacterium]
MKSRYDDPGRYFGRAGKEPGFIARLIDHTILKAFASPGRCGPVRRGAAIHLCLGVRESNARGSVAGRLAGSPVKVQRRWFPLDSHHGAKVAEKRSKPWLMARTGSTWWWTLAR